MLGSVDQRLLSCSLEFFIAYSHNPPWCNARDGMKLNVILAFSAYFLVSCFDIGRNPLFLKDKDGTVTLVAQFKYKSHIDWFYIFYIFVIFIFDILVI